MNATEPTSAELELQAGEIFEPAQWSLEDLRFLLEHLGKPPAVAMRLSDVNEPGVHKQAVRRLLTDVYSLEQVAAAEDGFTWAGIETLTDSIARFLAWHDRSSEIRRRKIKDASGSIISYPSMYAWDDDGRAYKFGVDSDASDLVRSEILDDGSRKPFRVDLLRDPKDLGPQIHEVAPWVKSPQDRVKVKDEVTKTHSKDGKLGHFTCSICSFSQQFEAKDRSKENIAMARMRKHMKDARNNINRHRLLLNKLAR